MEKVFCRGHLFSPKEGAPAKRGGVNDLVELNTATSLLSKTSFRITLIALFKKGWKTFWGEFELTSQRGEPRKRQ